MSNTEPSETGGAELRLLAGVRREHAVPDPDTIDRLRHAVLNATRHGAAPARGARRPWRIAIPVGATAFGLAALLAAGAFLTGGGVDGPPSRATATDGTSAIGDSADAHRVMTLVAQTAQTQPRLAAAPGQYIYRQTRSTEFEAHTAGAETVNFFEEVRDQVWLDPSKGLAPVRMLSTRGLNRRPATPKDAEVAARIKFDLNAPPTTDDSDHPIHGGGRQEKPRPSAGSMRNPTPQYLDGLPTEPAKLLALIRQQASSESSKGSTDKMAFDMIIALIQWGDPVLSPELRAALYQAVPMMPGVRRVDGQTDLAGRAGVSIGFAEGNVRQELILDPTSFRPFGARVVLLAADDGVPAGAISTSTFDFKVVTGTDQTS
jgi:hypothetical protein